MQTLSSVTFTYSQARELAELVAGLVNLTGFRGNFDPCDLPSADEMIRTAEINFAVNSKREEVRTAKETPFSWAVKRVGDLISVVLSGITEKGALSSKERVAQMSTQEKEVFARKYDERLKREEATRKAAELKKQEEARKVARKEAEARKLALRKIKEEKAAAIRATKAAERRARMQAIREKFREVKATLVAKVRRQVENLMEEFYETGRVIAYLFEVRYFDLIKEVQEDRIKILFDLECFLFV